MEQEPYVIAEERRKTQGEKYRYKEDEENLVPEIFRMKKNETVYKTPEFTYDLIQIVESSGIDLCFLTCVSQQQCLPPCKARCGGSTGRRWPRCRGSTRSRIPRKVRKTENTKYKKSRRIYFCFSRSQGSVTHFIIVKADTIVDPRAVMVHFEGTFLTDRTVMRPARD